jgi:hypothetical protein
VIALEMWDDECAYLLSHHSVDIARETGTLSELALALSSRIPCSSSAESLHCRGDGR